MQGVYGLDRHGLHIVLDLGSIFNPTTEKETNIYVTIFSMNLKVR